MSPNDSQYGEPEHFLVHISDTHLVGESGLLYGRVDSDAHLVRAFDRLRASGRRPEAIVLTGDLADSGDPSAYRRLRHIVADAAETLGARIIWVIGNHDNRVAVRTELLDQAASTEPLDTVHDVNGLRVIVLDTTVPGHHYGELDNAQLDWLAEVLRTPALHGSVLALHHPPVPTVVSALEAVELRDHWALEEVVRGSDIRAILGGHLHYSTTSTFAGIPVSVASATCYTQDVVARSDGGMRAQDGAQSLNLVHLWADRVVHTVVPIDTAPTVYEFGMDAVRSALELSAADIHARLVDGTPF